MNRSRPAMLVPKDGVLENTHPLNLVEVGAAAAGRASGAAAGVRASGAAEGGVPDVTRPPLYEVYMRMAEELAKRSTCSRLQVGTVITDPQLENVVAIGYNGNVRGFPNRCDSPEPGKCGCIHSEQNALVKAPGQMRDKVAFVTASPCIACAKLMIQANVGYLFYRGAYRDWSGMDILRQGGVVTVPYTRWQHQWR